MLELFWKSSGREWKPRDFPRKRFKSFSFFQPIRFESMMRISPKSPMLPVRLMRTQIKILSVILVKQAIFYSIQKMKVNREIR
ncbi:hypothetical protein QR98_0043270 [Sarcoptes scabiei]|uniref:Uncharacterized protein n=1 Tax=Sarcoptes scabiei TaxID=52283 RepID=A0A132A5F8_SARSC|nr:hypothetical protein QR98_0043270 [Sarcoptes scabiei]